MKQQFISGEEICFVGGGWNLSRVGDVREGEMRLCFEKKGLLVKRIMKDAM